MLKLLKKDSEAAGITVFQKAFLNTLETSKKKKKKTKISAEISEVQKDIKRNQRII